MFRKELITSLFELDFTVHSLYYTELHSFGINEFSVIICRLVVWPFLLLYGKNILFRVRDFFTSEEEERSAALLSACVQTTSRQLFSDVTSTTADFTDLKRHVALKNSVRVVSGREGGNDLCSQFSQSFSLSYFPTETNCFSRHGLQITST